MIIIQLPSGERAIVKDGVWTVPNNAEMSRVLNAPHMQPTSGYYAPSPDAAMAEHVLNTVGGRWLSTTERWAKGKLY